MNREKPACIQEVDEGEWMCIVLYHGAWEEKLDVEIRIGEFSDGTQFEEEIRTCLVCGDQDISYPC